MRSHDGMVDGAAALCQAYDIYSLLDFCFQHCMSSVLACPGISSHHAHSEVRHQYLHSEIKVPTYQTKIFKSNLKQLKSYDMDTICDRQKINIFA